MRRLVGLLVFAAAALTAIPADAELIRITPVGESAAGYEETGAEVSPVLIGSDGFRLTYHGGGDQPLLNPVMLIIGVPDGETPGYLPAPLLAFSGESDPAMTVDVVLGDTQQERYGGTWQADGYAGTFDSSAGSQSVYQVIGFTPVGSDSQNYTNWSGATGLTSWDLYVYALYFDPELLNRGDWAEFTTSLPVGSYVIGYGCAGDLDDNGLCEDQPGGGNNGDTESTPFTFAGLVVPEPATLTLMLPGLALLFARRRRGIRAA